MRSASGTPGWMPTVSSNAPQLIGALATVTVMVLPSNICVHGGADLDRGECGDGVVGGCGGGRLAAQAGSEGFDLIDQRTLEDGIAAVAHHELATAGAERADHLDPAAVAMVEATAERDHRDSPTGQLSGGEHTLGVARDRLDRVDVAVDTACKRDVLAGEPAHHVELVHSHVEQRTAAREAEGGGGRFAVPLPRLDESDLAERTAGDLVAQRAQFGDEPAPVADLEWRAGRRRPVGGVLRVGALEPAWLLAQRGHACRHERIDEIAVQTRRGSDQRGVEPARAERRVERLVELEAASGELLAGCRERLDDSDRSNVIRSAHRLEMDPAHSAGTDDENAQRHGSTFYRNNLRLAA